MLAFFSAAAVASAVPPKVAVVLTRAPTPASQLERTRTIELPGGATVYRFQRRVKGIPVLGGEAVVNDPAGAPPRLVSSPPPARIGSQPAPQVSRGKAVNAAEAAVGVDDLRGSPSARLAIQRGSGGTLVWNVRIPSAQPLGDFQVLLGAESGEVLRRQPIAGLPGREGAGLRPESSGQQSRRPRSPRQGGRDSKRLNDLRVRVKLHRLVDHQHCLKGRFAKVLVGAHEDPVCRRSLNWNRIKRSNEKYEALMAYYHVDHEQSYVQSLGFHNVDNRRQVVLADKIPDDNSFFSPFTRTLTLGTGGVDDGEDADVISHEYGQSIQNSESPAFLRSTSLEAGSLAEGSADYMAAVMSAQDRGTTNTDDVCIFDWDAQTWGTLFPSLNRHCGRRADNPST